MKVFDLYKISFEFAKSHRGWALLFLLNVPFIVCLAFLHLPSIVNGVISFLVNALIELITLCFVTQGDLSKQKFIDFLKNAPKSFYLVFAVIEVMLYLLGLVLGKAIAILTLIHFFVTIIYYILLTKQSSLSEALSKGFPLYFENFGRYIWYYIKNMSLVLVVSLIGLSIFSPIGMIIENIIGKENMLSSTYARIYTIIVMLIVCTVVFTIPFTLSTPLFVKHMLAPNDVCQKEQQEYVMMFEEIKQEPYLIDYEYSTKYDDIKQDVIIAQEDDLE